MLNSINHIPSHTMPLTIPYHPCFSPVWNPGWGWVHKLSSGIDDMTSPRICSLNQRAHGGTFNHSCWGCLSLCGGILSPLTWRGEVGWAWGWSGSWVGDHKISQVLTSSSSLGKGGSAGQRQLHSQYEKHKELPHSLTELNCWQAEQLLSD